MPLLGLSHSEEDVFLTQLGPLPQSIARDRKVGNDPFHQHATFLKIPCLVEYTTWLWDLHVPSILHLGNFSPKLPICHNSLGNSFMLAWLGESELHVLFLAPPSWPLSKVVMYGRNAMFPSTDVEKRDSRQKS